MKINRFAAAFIVAAGTSWGSDFVEVSLRFEAQGIEVFHPMFVVETGRTADIRQAFNPDSGNSIDVLSNPFGLEQRVLVTVNRSETQGYGVHVEYMQRRGRQWVSVMQPTFHVREYTDASTGMSNASGGSLNVTASVTPRYDVTSLGDVQCYRSPSDAQCPAMPTESDVGTGVLHDQGRVGSHYFNPIGGPLGHHCCSVDCGNGNTLTCCNSCCSDEVMCLGKSCCGGYHP